MNRYHEKIIRTRRGTARRGMVWHGPAGQRRGRARLGEVRKMKVEVKTTLQLHGVTISDFWVNVHYRYPAWTDEVPFGLADEPIIDAVSFEYLDGVSIDLWPIYHRHPSLMWALEQDVQRALAGLGGAGPGSARHGAAWQGEVLK